MDTINQALSLPLPLLITSIVAVILAVALATVTARWVVKTAVRVATNGLDKAQKSADPSTAVLAWARKRLIIPLGCGMLMAASYGMIRFLLGGANHPIIVAILISAGVEGAVLAMTVDLYLKSRTQRSTSRPRSASWLFATVSAVANFTHAPTDDVAGAAIFGAVPLLGAFLLEYQAGEERKERALPKRGLTGSAVTRFAQAAWRRLWAVAAAKLGLDINAHDTDVERTARVTKAGRLMYELGEAQRQGTVSRRRLRRLEARTQRARAAAGVDLDPEAHRAVLRHMRMYADTVSESLDEAPFEPFSTVLGRTATADAVRTSTGSGSRTNTGPTPGNETGQDTASGPDASRTGQRPNGRDHGRTGNADEHGATSRNVRTKPRTGRRSKPGRARPDVTDLIPVGQQVYRELWEADEPLTRDRFTTAIRERGHTVGGDRASELWRAVNNGSKPVLQ